MGIQTRLIPIKEFKFNSMSATVANVLCNTATTTCTVWPVCLLQPRTVIPRSRARSLIDWLLKLHAFPTRRSSERHVVQVNYSPYIKLYVMKYTGIIVINYYDFFGTTYYDRWLWYLLRSISAIEQRWILNSTT